MPIVQFKYFDYGCRPGSAASDIFTSSELIVLSLNKGTTGKRKPDSGNYLKFVEGVNGSILLE